MPKTQITDCIRYRIIQGHDDYYGEVLLDEKPIYTERSYFVDILSQTLVEKIARLEKLFWKIERCKQGIGPGIH